MEITYSISVSDERAGTVYAMFCLANCCVNLNGGADGTYTGNN